MPNIYLILELNANKQLVKLEKHFSLKYQMYYPIIEIL